VCGVHVYVGFSFQPNKILVSVKTKVLTVFKIEIMTFWILSPCILVMWYHSFRGTCSFHLQGTTSPHYISPKRCYVVKLYYIITQKTAIWSLDNIPAFCFYFLLVMCRLYVPKMIFTAHLYIWLLAICCVVANNSTDIQTLVYAEYKELCGNIKPLSNFFSV